MTSGARSARQCRCRPAIASRYGGQFESEQRASQRLLGLGLIAVTGVFMLLVLAFGRARDAVIVMVNLPLALIGGVAGVFSQARPQRGHDDRLHHLVRDRHEKRIMLVTHVRHLMEVEGVGGLREAVERGAGERLVPILMTAAAAGLALIPLALRGGRDGQ